MPLSAERLSFALNQILSSEPAAFRGLVKQLYSYLERESQSNREFLRLNAARSKWTSWPESKGQFIPADWTMPDTEDDSKSLAFDLYASCVEQTDGGMSLMLTLFGDRHPSTNLLKFNATFGPFLRLALEDILAAESAGSQPSVPATGQASEPVIPNNEAHRNLFVIYGRNEKARTAMFAFLRALGLAPIEWPHVLDAEQEPNPDIERAVSKRLTSADAVLCLLTPDDIGHLRKELQVPTDPIHDREPTPQPRLNVVYELGMAMQWKLTKTVIARLGETRPISDVGGRHIPRFTGDLASRQDLIRRLKKAGLKVNDTGTDWHDAGDFAAALAFVSTSAKTMPTGSSEEDKRLDEIAAEAAEKFEGWCVKHFKNEPRNTGLLIRWIESGCTTYFHDFGYDMLRLMVEKLRGRGNDDLTCPTKREYEGALQVHLSRPPRWRQVGF